MFFITCFEQCQKNELGWFDGGNERTFGFFDNLETCKQALRENWCDMNETIYNFAVIEYIPQGIHPKAREIAWFHWDKERDGFFECEKPNATNHIVNHALG